MSAKVYFGMSFGERTGYCPEEKPYDQKRAWLDLMHIESFPTDVNIILERVKYAKNELEVEVAAIQDGQRQNYRRPKIKNFEDLAATFGGSTVSEWRQNPSYYASLALEIEYRVACAQRYRVEEAPDPVHKRKA